MPSDWRRPGMPRLCCEAQPCIPAPNHAKCAPAAFTGPGSAALYTVCPKRVALRSPAITRKILRWSCLVARCLRAASARLKSSDRCWKTKPRQPTPVSGADCAHFVSTRSGHTPGKELALDHHDKLKQQQTRGNQHGERGEGLRHLERRCRIQNQIAKTAFRCDEFGDDGADDGQRDPDLQRAENVGHGEGQAD